MRHSDIVRLEDGTRVAWPLRAEAIKARDVRNSFEIMGYTGANGGGKTTAAVYDALPFLAVGRPIVATVRILDPRTGEPHPLFVPLDDYRILLDVERAVVIADEVTGLAGARDHAAFPSDVLNRSQQFRKADVLFKWTTPDWRNADAGIRRVSKGVTVSRGFAPVNHVEVDDDGLRRMWTPMRGHSWKTYDARNFDEFNVAKERSPSKQHRIRPVRGSRQIFWGPEAPVRSMFDTYQQAITLGVVSEGGTCYDCGGKRAPKKCVCNTGGAVKDASPGMLAWRDIAAARAARKALVEIPETDDTPGVLVETDA